MGTLSEGKNGTKTVNEDFRLVTFDIVADPSTRGAYPSLSESREHKKEKQIIESTIKTVVGERYFLKLLEKKIDEKLNEAKERSPKALKRAMQRVTKNPVGSRKSNKALKTLGSEKSNRDGSPKGKPPVRDPGDEDPS
jgi:hypothetical protein